MSLFDSSYIYFRLSEIWFGISGFFTNETSPFFDIVSTIKFLAALFSIFFVLGTIYSVLRVAKIRRKQLNEIIKRVIESSLDARTPRWEKIKHYLESENSSDWRRAILEADNLLDDIFRRAGYKGATLGRKLLKVRPYQFQSLEELFRAHIMRNRIVQEGSGFELTKEQAEEILNLYEKALKELEYIC